MSPILFKATTLRVLVIQQVLATVSGPEVGWTSTLSWGLQAL